MHSILTLITFGLYNRKGMKNKKKENYFIRATKEDNNINPIYLFLLIILAVGILLLFVPIVGMIVDIIYNKTITINLSDMSLYIGAVAAIFTGGGITGAITEYSYSKFKVKPLDENGRGICDDEHDHCDHCKECCEDEQMKYN